MTAALHEIDVRAEQNALQDLPVVVNDLVRLLGGSWVAAIGGVKQTRNVAQWIKGEVQPRGDAEHRLRLAERVATILRSRVDDTTARAWFFGANHRLDDEMPLAVIAAGDLQKAPKQVLGAARDFVSL